MKLVSGLENCISDALSRYPWKSEIEICSIMSDENMFEGQFLAIEESVVTWRQIEEA